MVRKLAALNKSILRHGITSTEKIVLPGINLGLKFSFLQIKDFSFEVRRIKPFGTNICHIYAK